jgi:predicted NUDIX family phosphoesterase
MEDKYNGEEVLVFPRILLTDIGYFNGSSPDAERYLKTILTRGNNHFHLRIKAETDPSLKQIIPYVLFVCGDQVFSYVRGKQAGETRLVGNRSVGIGGHVNPIDEQRDAAGGSHAEEDFPTYLKAVRREIDEEVVVEVDGPLDIEMIGLINDDSNPVGQVHFGVIHVCRLPVPRVRKREDQITQAGFVSIAELAGPRREELETWSQIAIDFLNR